MLLHMIHLPINNLLKDFFLWLVLVNQNRTTLELLGFVLIFKHNHYQWNKHKTHTHIINYESSFTHSNTHNIHIHSMYTNSIIRFCFVFQLGLSDIDHLLHRYCCRTCVDLTTYCFVFFCGLWGLLQILTFTVRFS